MYLSISGLIWKNIYFIISLTLNSRTVFKVRIETALGGNNDSKGTSGDFCASNPVFLDMSVGYMGVQLVKI